MPQIPIWLTMVLNKISIPSLLGYRAIRLADTPSTSQMQWLVILLLFFTANTVFCQVKGDYIWLGGYQLKPEGGRKGYEMNFDEKNVEAKQIVFSLGFAGNNTSISDQDGKLLFYTNGCAVMNRNHEVMPNGDSINAGQWFDIYWKDCLYGYPGFQDVMIVDDPANSTGYYLFHKANVYYPMIADSFQLMYSYIDMSLDGWKGDVLVKNEKYYDKQDVMYSYFTGVKHKNKKDWWIIQPLINDSVFLTFLLNNGGIKYQFSQNTYQYFDDFRSSAGGSAKFSPDGSKYALYNYNDQLHIYDFDRETGNLSNHQKIEIYHPDSINRSLLLFSSVEWSPNGRFVYCASSEKLHQVDTWEDDPQDGVRHIADYNGTLDPFPTRLFLMVQGPDCRIYMTPKNGSYSLHVINKPNELGTACDFVQNAIKLPNSNSGTLPNFPRFRVDEAEKCDPTITSIFGDDVYYRKDLPIYPNPSTGVFRVVMPETFVSGTLVVTDIHGQILVKKSIDHIDVFQEIDITSLAGGVYHIEIYPSDNSTRIFYSKQVVKL